MDFVARKKMRRSHTAATTHAHCLLEYQFAAQTAGSLVCMARGNTTGHCLLAGDQVPGRPISGARFASGRLSLDVSWREIVQRRSDHREERFARHPGVALR